MRVELLSITPNAEELIEKAARVCYLSEESKTRKGRDKFIKGIIRRGHLSVIEHASATFRVTGVSRVFTHQMVRHRIASYSQQSQRYVNEKDFNFVEPETIKKNASANVLFHSIMKRLKQTYLKLQEAGIPKEDARFVLPNATETQIVITANLRQWRHIIQLRGSKNAQWEIRWVMERILRILKERVPLVFEDIGRR